MLTKANHDFKGWFLDEELTQPYDATTAVTSNFILYAKWELGYVAVPVLGDPVFGISIGCYDNTALKDGIYFCDRERVIPNNSLRWQYKILLSYDATIDAYKVVAVDAAKKGANSLGVEWTHAISSSKTDVSTYVSVGQYIYAGQKLTAGMGAFGVSVFADASFAKTAKITIKTVWIPIVSALLIWLLGVSPIWIILTAIVVGIAMKFKVWHKKQ